MCFVIPCVYFCSELSVVRTYSDMHSDTASAAISYDQLVWEFVRGTVWIHVSLRLDQDYNWHQMLARE